MPQLLKLSIYDFDDTLYRGDSSIRFWWFALLRRPWLLLLTPWFLLILGLHACGIIQRDLFKQNMFLVIHGIPVPTLEQLVSRFWEREFPRINPWVRERLERESKEGFIHLCISASPRFLLQDTVARLGIRTLLCTEMLVQQGRQTRFMNGFNCRGEQKIRRLEQWARENNVSYEVVRFCSDSPADLPMYSLAREKYKVEHGVLSEGTP